MAGGEASERVGKPDLRIGSAELAGLDHAGDDGPMVAAIIGPGEQGIFAIQGQRTDRTLDGVGVDLDATVVEENRVSPVQRVSA